MTTELRRGSRPLASDSVDVRILAPLCLTAFVGLLNVGVLSPFIPDIADDLGVTVSLIGLTATASLLATACGGLLVGPLADRYGHRRAILVGLALLAVSAIGAAGSITYGMIFAARLIGGLGFAATSGVTSAIAASRFESDARRRALSFLSTASVTAGIVGAPILTTVGGWTSWRGAFLLVSLCAGLAIAGVWLGVPTDELSEAEPDDLMADYRTLLRSHSMLVLYAATGLQMLCQIGGLTYTGAYLIDEAGFSVREVGWAFMVVGIGGFLASSALGSRLPAIDLRLLYGIALVGMALLWLLIFMLPVNGYLATGMLGLTSALQVAAWISLATMLAGETPVGQGTTMVLNGSILGLGGALGTALGSVTIAVAGYTLVGVVLAVAALASALIVLRGRVQE